MKEIKILSLPNLDRRQVDTIEDITQNEVHWWKRNDKGGIDLYYYLETYNEEIGEQ